MTDLVIMTNFHLRLVEYLFKLRQYLSHFIETIFIRVV